MHLQLLLADHLRNIRKFLPMWRHLLIDFTLDAEMEKTSLLLFMVFFKNFSNCCGTSNIFVCSFKSLELVCSPWAEESHLEWQEGKVCVRHCQHTHFWEKHLDSDLIIDTSVPSPTPLLLSHVLAIYLDALFNISKHKGKVYIQMSEKTTSVDNNP